MLSNARIQQRIKMFGAKIGLVSDNSICKRCKFNDATMIGRLAKLKTAPQLDTLDKFARGLGVRIEDLIYDRTDADMEMARIWDELSEYEKTETIVWVKVQQREKNKQKQSVAA